MNETNSTNYPKRFTTDYLNFMNVYDELSEPSRMEAIYYKLPAIT